MTAEDYQVSARAYGPVTVISCRAERYPSAALEPVRAVAEQHAPQGQPAIIVFDLSEVIFISTAILRVLAIVHSRVGPAGGKVCTAGGGEMVRSVLGIAKLPFLTEYDTLSGALAALSPEASSIYASEEGT